jgi:hypothetical protein
MESLFGRKLGARTNVSGVPPLRIYSPKLMHISAYLIELVAINGFKLELKREFGSFTFTHPSPISHVSFSLSFKY